MKTKWKRDHYGYYHHKDYDNLVIIPSANNSAMRWEIVRLKKPYGFELIKRYALLANAKRTVEMEGVRWNINQKS